MRLETTHLKPKLSTFLGLIGLFFIAHLLLRIILQVFTSWDAIQLNSLLWWFNFIFLTVGLSLGLTLGTRKFQLKITNMDDIERVKNWILEYFSNNGLRTKNNDKVETTLESINWFNRLFNNWFGTELVSVRQIENKIIVEGPTRHVDSVNGELRFGKPLS